MPNIFGNRDEVPQHDGWTSPRPRTVSISDMTLVSPYASPTCLSRKQANHNFTIPENVLRQSPNNKKPKIIHGAVPFDMIAQGLTVGAAIHGSAAGDLVVAFAPPQGDTDFKAIPSEEELENQMLELSPFARVFCTPMASLTPFAAAAENPPNVAKVSPRKVKVILPESRTAMPPIHGDPDFRPVSSEEDREDMVLELPPAASCDLCAPTPFTSPPPKVSPERLSSPKAQTFPDYTTTSATVRTILESQRKDTVAPKKGSPRFSPSKETRIYRAKKRIKAHDIYCGREFRGSSHPGNAAFRRIIKTNKKKYQALSSIPRKLKTDMSNAILEEIEGRFFAEAEGGRFYLLTKGEARNKVRQSLAEKN